MDRLEKLVIDHNLVLVDELHSPNSGATYNGYIDSNQTKTGWGQ